MPQQIDRERLEWLPGRHAVCRLEPHDPVPTWAASGPQPQAPSLLSITRTERELSIVIDESRVPADVKAERGFAALRIAGTLDFNLVGVLARLTSALAQANVPVFVISTFDTDVLLVREHDRARATTALQAASGMVTPPPPGAP